MAGDQWRTWNLEKQGLVRATARYMDGSSGYFVRISQTQRLVGMDGFLSAAQCRKIKLY
jgi:hypothetical protein